MSKFVKGTRLLGISFCWHFFSLAQAHTHTPHSTHIRFTATASLLYHQFLQKKKKCVSERERDRIGDLHTISIGEEVEERGHLWENK